MLEKIILSERIKEELTDICVSYNKEFGGYFLGEITSEGIYVDQGLIEQGEENSASINYIPRDLWDKVQNNPKKYILIPVHIHSRKSGEKVESYDPIWSKGDAKVMEASKIKNKFEYTLFIHPKLGREGEKMSNDKVQITSYKYNSLNLDNVEEIETEFEESFDDAYSFCNYFSPNINCHLNPKILKEIKLAIKNITKNYRQSVLIN